jgi:putative transposase
MQVSEVKRLKELEDENRRLKKMYAELSLQNESSRKPWQKSGEARRASNSGQVDG